jgi:hypothetical protein
MGFKYDPNTYNLSFEEGHFLHGLNVKVRSVGLGKFTKISTLAMAASAVGRADLSEEEALKASVEALEAVEGLFDLFSSCLVSWDLEDAEGKPIPATKEGLHELDLEFVMALITEWQTVIGGVSQSLGKGSVSGGTSPVPPIQMPEMVAL